MDFERARKFYGSIYDFDMPSTTMGNSQLGFFPVQPGCIGGAIIKGEGGNPSQNGTLVYLNGGKDLNTVLQRVETAGGKVNTQKTAISAEHGFFALFTDTESNKVALHSMQ